MKNQILIQILLTILFASWHSIAYADTTLVEKNCNQPLYQYLLGEFFQGKTESFLQKYQPVDKDTVGLSYLPLRNVIETDVPSSNESITIFNQALSDYLAIIVGQISALKQLTPPTNSKLSQLNQILGIGDDFITSREKIQRIEKLFELTKPDVIVTGHYLEKAEDNTIKVKLIVVSIHNKRIEKRILVVQPEKSICAAGSQHTDKVLCPAFYQEMVTAINTIFFNQKKKVNTPISKKQGNPNISKTIFDKKDQIPKPKNISSGKIGLLPFSRLTSEKVKNQLGKYYEELEQVLSERLSKKELSVESATYPATQQPFTYEEMTAPLFEIDPEDFATPEQILQDIGQDQTFDKIIFGHLEEISDSVYFVARVFNLKQKKIISAPLQKIKITELEADKIESAIDKLASEIMDKINPDKKKGTNEIYVKLFSKAKALDSMQCFWTPKL